jgi:hypothetical protein
VEAFDLEAVQPFLNAMYIFKNRVPLQGRFLCIEITCLDDLACIMPDSRFCLSGKLMGRKGAQCPAVDSMLLPLVENILEQFS